MKDPDNVELNTTFLNTYLLEDEIYQQLDKLQALVSLHSLLNTTETPPTKTQSLYYTITVEEQLIKLRTLVDQLFR